MNRRKGITLLELFIIIAINVLLLTLIVFRMSGSIIQTEHAREITAYIAEKEAPPSNS